VVCIGGGGAVETCSVELVCAGCEHPASNAVPASNVIPSIALKDVFVAVIVLYSTKDR
jgi:hypothetical protein